MDDIAPGTTVYITNRGNAEAAEYVKATATQHVVTSRYGAEMRFRRSNREEVGRQSRYGRPSLVLPGDDTWETIQDRAIQAHLTQEARYAYNAWDRSPGDPKLTRAAAAALTALANHQEP